MLRRIWDKSFQAKCEESAKALNYCWGMSAGVVEWTGWWKTWKAPYFVHGHIHKSYGISIPQETFWGSTMIINAYDHCVFDYTFTNFDLERVRQ